MKLNARKTLIFLKEQFKSREDFTTERKVILVIATFMAFLFWTIVMLSQEYSQNYTQKIVLKNFPSDQIITSDFPSTIEFNIKTSGWNLISFKKKQNFVLDFESFEQNKLIPKHSITKVIEDNIPKNSTLISFKPEFIRFNYDKKSIKKVPLVIDIKYQCIENFTLFQPPIKSIDSVIIAGPRYRINEISFIVAESINETNLSEKIEINSFFQEEKRVEIVSDDICVQFYPEKFIHKTITIPIKSQATKALPLLILNPSRVKIKFKQKVDDFESYHIENFELVADFDQINFSQDSIIPIQINRFPEKITDIRLSQEYSAFLISSE